MATETLTETGMIAPNRIDRLIGKLRGVEQGLLSDDLVELKWAMSKDLAMVISELEQMKESRGD